MEQNKKNEKGVYLLLLVTFNNNIKIVHLLIDYANKNNIFLEINKMDEFENNPLIFAIYNKNNIELIKLMTNYVNKKKIRSK